MFGPRMAEVRMSSRADVLVVDDQRPDSSSVERLASGCRRVS